VIKQTKGGERLINWGIASKKGVQPPKPILHKKIVRLESSMECSVEGEGVLWISSKRRRKRKGHMFYTNVVKDLGKENRGKKG